MCIRDSFGGAHTGCPTGRPQTGGLSDGGQPRNPRRPWIYDLGTTNLGLSRACPPTGGSSTKN
eukprot:4871801-Pyramimonas_sp.AAC.1